MKRLVRRPAPMHALWLAFLGAMAWGTADVRMAAGAEAQTVKFAVFWPPQHPRAAAVRKTRALLNGELTLQARDLAATGWVASVRIALGRAADDAGREFWNTQLAFPEYDWMSSVRVWDPDHRWLWPNLACLLRLHGKERVDRYGGVDPGKGVDNDFAAVLIRTYDAAGETESEETKKAPLVSAEWHAAGGVKVDRRTVVHTAESDPFMLRLGRPGEAGSGRVGIWLIYADFLGATPPAGWPKEPEYAGGILAFFEVRWAKSATGPPEIRVEQMVPRRATGFDWEGWTLRTLAAPDTHFTAKLTEADPPLRLPQPRSEDGSAKPSQDRP